MKAITTLLSIVALMLGATILIGAAWGDIGLDARRAGSLCPNEGNCTHKIVEQSIPDQLSEEWEQLNLAIARALSDLERSAVSQVRFASRW